MVWKKRSWRKKNAPEDIGGVIALIVLLLLIYVLKIVYAIIVTYWMWLLLLLIIGIIGWIYLKKDTNSIQDIKRSQPFIIDNPEKEQTYASKLKSYIDIKSNDSSLNNNEENHNKGVIFEQYVLNLFAPSFFSLYDCTRDNSKHFNRKVESDQNPDITMRYIPKNELFSIECKFRSGAYDDKVSWARYDQIINYLSYAAQNKRPVFVVIGLGGRPDNPNRMFCIPIEDAKYPELFISRLRKYERKPSDKFFWKEGNLR